MTWSMRTSWNSESMHVSILRFWISMYNFFCVNNCIWFTYMWVGKSKLTCYVSMSVQIKCFKKVKVITFFLITFILHTWVIKQLWCESKVICLNFKRARGKFFYNVNTYMHENTKCLMKYFSSLVSFLWTMTHSYISVDFFILPCYQVKQWE